MNKVWSNNKGVMSNKTFERITTILWIVGIVGMIGLLIALNKK